MIPVKEKTYLYRDISGALINTDRDSYESYLKQRDVLKKQQSSINTMQVTINNLNSEISQLKDLVSQLLEKVK